MQWNRKRYTFVLLGYHNSATLKYTQQDKESYKILKNDPIQKHGKKSNYQRYYLSRKEQWKPRNFNSQSNIKIKVNTDNIG